MDAQTCIKKLGYVGILSFATVDEKGHPQVRSISAVHFEPDAIYFYTARGKNFCRQLLDDGHVQIEYFNLGVRPIDRYYYTMGDATPEVKGFSITDACIQCGTCMANCPQECIIEGEPFRIQAEHCLHCGNCFENCPVEAIVRLD